MRQLWYGVQRHHGCCSSEEQLRLKRGQADGKGLQRRNAMGEVVQHKGVSFNLAKLQMQCITLRQIGRSRLTRECTAHVARHAAADELEHDLAPAYSMLDGGWVLLGCTL